MQIRPELGCCNHNARRILYTVAWD